MNFFRYHRSAFRAGRRLFSSRPQEPRRRFRLAPYLLAAGAGSYSYYLYRNYEDACSKEKSTGIPAHKLTMYRLLPANSMTKVAGKMAQITIPDPLRSPLFGLYSLLFGCRLDEAEIPSLRGYSTFQAFFTRSLKDGVRPLADADLVSPVDGKILAMGRIEVPLPRENGEALAFPEQIKGISYPLRQLVPEATFKALTSTNKPIHYCTIYLAPGDYHRFHSPADWKQSYEPVRINGEALSVAPYMMKWVRNLLCLNERAVLGGTWKHGAFSMIPVGATNVRSIRLEEKTENLRAKYQKGELLGMFELGSTVVLLFHAPETFAWSPAVGDKIQMGQALGNAPRTYKFISGLF